MDNIDKAVQRLKAEDDFRCEHEFIPIHCRNRHCNYFYITDYQMGIGRCLKKEIKEWVIYHNF